MTNPSNKSTLIRCWVTPQSRPAPEGLEAVELYVCWAFDSLVEKPPVGTRVEIRLLTTAGVFRAGIRTFPGNRKEVYVCPNLVSEKDGRKVSLAKVLKECGIEHRTEVDVRIRNGEWEILQTAQNVLAAQA